MTKKIISQVRKSKSGQRRVTIPKEEKTLEESDYVEIKKVDLK